MKLLRKISLVSTVILGANLLVFHFLNVAVAQISPPTFSYSFGSSGSGNGQFNAPHQIGIDHSGNIYVSDSNNNRVEKFNSSGVYQSQFGSTGTGNGQFSGPQGIAIDRSGDINVVDSGNNRVEKFNSSGVYQSQFGSTGTGNGQFSLPQGIAIDSSGNIYVGDSNNGRVEKFNSSGVYQSQFNNTGSGNAQFNPGSIVIDGSGNIYVADLANEHVEKFNSSGVYQSEFGGTGTGNGQFQSLASIDIDGSGNIYADDLVAQDVQEFNASGLYQFQFGSAGSGNGQFNGPNGIALDSVGNIYVVDSGNNRVQVFTPPAAASTSIGQAVETISPGILQLTNVPANFNFAPVNIMNFQTYNTTYINQQNGTEQLTADDRRFSGGFEVQVTATDYAGNKSGDAIPVSDLGVLTQAPNSTNNYTQTTDLQNTYSSTAGTLLSGSQTQGAVISQTLPFQFSAFGIESNTIYICATGAIFQGADLLGLQPGNFSAFCSSNSSLPSGNYNIISPYFKKNVSSSNDLLNTTANPSCTTPGTCFDFNNGVYYQQISNDEVMIRYKGNTANVDSTQYYDVEFSVYLFKDGRIEYHYGPVTDADTYPLIGIANNPGPSINLISANIAPFNTTTQTDFSTSQIRFSPQNTIFNDVSKPNTPPVYASLNSTSANAADFTMFTEDSPPGNSVPVTIMEGAACDTQGRLGTYTVYPSFLLQIPPTTPADTYTNTITFTILDKTIPSGTSFCPSGG